MDFHYSVVTEKTVDQAVQALEESLKANKFGVLWQLDLPAKLREKGVDYDTPYRVLEVCNPHEAKPTSWVLFAVQNRCVRSRWEDAHWIT